MVRIAVVYSFPAALIAISWLRLEDPQAAGLDGWWILALALAPALAPTLALRLAFSVPAALTALWVAFDQPAPDDKRGFFVPVAERFADGLNGFFNVAVPFSGLERVKMHGVVVIAIFGFCLVLAHAIAARRPLVAVLAVVAGAGWAATLYPSRSVLFGAVILAGALWALAGLRSTQPVTALLAGAALVLVAAAASTSAAVAKDAVLPWERWDPSSSFGGAISVSYVWDAQYGGIQFSKKERTVIRITGPKRGFYWRATTLDQFDSDRWLDNPIPLSTGLATGRLPNDPLLPTHSLDPRTWVKQEVEIGALRDQHIIGAAQPVALDGPDLGGVFYLSGGLVRVYGGLKRGQRYTIYSYAPRPEPADLARVAAKYPPGLERFFDIGRTRVEPFGVAGRDAHVEALFDDERYVALWPYQELWNQAKRLRAGARTPYGAVVAIETWLRSTGGFTYDESPPATGGLPPLAHFVTEGKRGYCQHFAGAMALMLRFLGIPARVAGGFTSGKREGDTWVVTDHNAHAWVEAWFPGYGWLAFDPTPGRGSLTGNYSASSTGFNAGDAADAFDRPAGAGVKGGASELQRLLQKERLAERQRAGGAAADDGRPAVLWLLLVAVVAAAGAIGAAKVIRRRLRYLTRDPRRLAGAARRELADFLVDQGLEVRPSATPDELRQLVREELGADGRRFAAALAEARFGPPDKSAAAAAQARKELRALLRVIRNGLGRTARFRGLVALRSLRA
jgi:transglutaminase superfamily protein/transglutaminase TgpA-like protein